MQVMCYLIRVLHYLMQILYYLMQILYYLIQVLYYLIQVLFYLMQVLYYLIQASTVLYNTSTVLFNTSIVLFNTSIMLTWLTVFAQLFLLLCNDMLTCFLDSSKLLKMPGETKVSHKTTTLVIHPRKVQKTKQPAVRKPSSAPLLTARRQDGVRECMVWRNNSLQKDNKENELQTTEGKRCEKYLLPRSVVGRPLDRGFNVPEDWKERPKPHTGTAIEALRGWPCLQSSSPSKPTQEMMSARYPHEEEKIFITDASKVKKSTKSKKNGKKKFEDKPLVIELDESRDPNFPELISHRFLFENLVKEAEEKKAKDIVTFYDDDVSDDATKLEVKSNKAAQLRAIHLGQKIDVNPKNLWQMKQFKNGAKSQLNTFRRKEKVKVLSA